MRIRLLLFALAAALVGYALSAHVAPSPPRASAARLEGAPDRAEHGGRVDIDSARAFRHAILRRIEESGTYLGPMLSDVDSTLKRWHVRTERPIRVFATPATAPGYRPEFDLAVRRAFVEWMGVPGIPVQFVFVADSSDAEVTLRWIERFATNRTGQADVTWDQDGWLRRGVLTLATHTPEGWPLDDDAVYTVALHEIGHLLGLGHSDNPEDVMSPTTSVHNLTPRDRRTASLLYSLPPGPLRDPVTRH